MSDALLAAFTIACVTLFAVLIYPALTAVLWRVLSALFGEREDLP